MPRVVMTLLLLTAAVASVADQKADSREQLSKLQALVVSWRGVGQPQRGSTKDSWIEEADALVFADNNGDSSTGFSGTLNLADCRQSRHDIIRGAWDCLEKLPTQRLKPRQHLVSRGYCLAEPGESYVVYLESPSAVDVKTDAGCYQVTWIDPRRPAEQNDGGATADGESLSPPSGGDDWLLCLTRERQ